LRSLFLFVLIWSVTVPILVARQPLQLAADGSLLSPRVTLVEPKTDRITLKIGRETTGGTNVFPATSQLTITIIIRVDGVEYRCVGKTTGGIRVGEAGEIAEYQLSYGLPVGFFGDRSGPQRRLGEGSTTFDAQLRIDLVGSAIDTEVIAEFTSANAPTGAFHSSVAFDTATDAVETSGDGVLSLSHTASGSDRAVFCAAGWGINSVTSTSFTYAGNSATEQWDIFNGFQGNAGYSLAGDSSVPTGSQTATSTLSGSTGTRHIIAVLSMTGVDSTTPVGSPQTRGSASNETSSSLTVTSVGADDLVVDALMVGNSSDPANSVGADQTERTTELENSSGNGRFSTSTQLGSSGGAMSWTFGGSAGGNSHGAIAFKPAAAGGGPGPVGENLRMLYYGGRRVA
jgi:hypothetical protein